MRFLAVSPTPESLRETTVESWELVATAGQPQNGFNRSTWFQNPACQIDA